MMFMEEGDRNMASVGPLADRQLTIEANFKRTLIIGSIASTRPRPSDATA